MSQDSQEKIYIYFQLNNERPGRSASLNLEDSKEQDTHDNQHANQNATHFLNSILTLLINLPSQSAHATSLPSEDALLPSPYSHSHPVDQPLYCLASLPKPESELPTPRTIRTVPQHSISELVNTINIIKFSNYMSFALRIPSLPILISKCLYICSEYHQQCSVFSYEQAL